MFQRAPSRYSALPVISDRSISATSDQCPRCLFEARGRSTSFFLAELPDALLMLAFFLSVVLFLEATFFATFFFVRELGFFAPIAVATLSHATPGAAVAVAAAETAAAAAALASSPVRVLVPSAALLAAATTVSCARVLMLFRVIFHCPEDHAETSYA